MKRVLALSLFVLFNLAVRSQTVSACQLVEFCVDQLGIKYRYGKASPSLGFDCSGFIFYVYNNFNVPSPRTSVGFSKTCRVIDPDSCKPGDVIVFTGTNPKNRRPGHVGVVLAKTGDNIEFIHSSSGKKKSGVKISSFKESPAYKKRFIKIVRVADLS